MQRFGGYRLLKRQQRLYFRRIIEKDLREFWYRFKKENKIKLLNEFAIKAYNYCPQVKITRLEFDKNIKIKKWLFSSCYVCGDKPTIAHHIIQIQNGGLNIKKNIIRICNNCHKKIHSWLS